MMVGPIDLFAVIVVLFVKIFTLFKFLISLRVPVMLVVACYVSCFILP